MSCYFTLHVDYLFVIFKYYICEDCCYSNLILNLRAIMKAFYWLMSCSFYLLMNYSNNYCLTFLSFFYFIISNFIFHLLFRNILILISHFLYSYFLYFFILSYIILYLSFHSFSLFNITSSYQPLYLLIIITFYLKLTSICNK
jgi:hypothetical protein